MTDIKLGRLPDRTPVKLVLSLTPELHRALVDYSALYESAYGEPARLEDLVPAMVERFIEGDRSFVRRRRTPPRS